MCVCVYVCVCERESESECVCVCVSCIFVSAAILCISLMLSGIKRLSMHVSLLGILPKDWQSLVRSVAGRTAGLWREAEEVKRKKEEEESALFWYKEKSHSFTEEDNVTFVEKLFPDFEFELETAEDNESRSVEMDMETGHLGPTVESEFTTDAGIKSALFTPQEMASIFTAMSQVEPTN